jgi:hypothetical protein
MRTNMPITNVEQHLQDGEYIVPKMDIKGCITYVNRPIMDMSRFSQEELLGCMSLRIKLLRTQAGELQRLVGFSSLKAVWVKAVLPGGRRRDA